MAKLHELLAVEGDLEGIYSKIVKETQDTFTKKPALFFGYNKRLEMFEEGHPEAPEESQEITDTVRGKMDYTAEHIIRYFDCELQKELTNQTAKADLEVDGAIIATDLPATFLLGLETKLKAVRRIYECMPTLAPGKTWEKDYTKGDDVYVSVPAEEKFKTAKTFKHKVLVPAQFPKEGEGGSSLPAQIERWEETENVGKYITKTWSGMITSAQKSTFIGRVDKLIRAVKKARQKANRAKVVKRTIGQELFDYINSGLA